MATTSVIFRGERDVEIEYRMGRYELDTNAQEVEWWFVGREAEDITPEEEEAIIQHLYGLEDDSYGDRIELGFLPIPRERSLGTPASEISGRPGHPGYEEFCRIARSWGYP